MVVICCAVSQWAGVVLLYIHLSTTQSIVSRDSTLFNCIYHMQPNSKLTNTANNTDQYHAFCYVDINMQDLQNPQGALLTTTGVATTLTFHFLTSKSNQFKTAVLSGVCYWYCVLFSKSRTVPPVHVSLYNKPHSHTITLLIDLP